MIRTIRLAAPAFLLASGLASSTYAQQFIDDAAARFGPPLNEFSNQIAMSDVDGDGDLDIAFANGGGFGSAQPPQRVRLYINNGAGVFTEESAARLGSLTAIARDLEFGDVDGDGDVDIAIAQDFARPALLLLNNGAGVFSNVSATHMPSLTMGSPHCSFGDVDDDGDLDLLFADGVTSRFGTGRCKLFINDGTGHFADETVARTPNVTTTQPMDGNLVDLNGDRHLDIIIASRSGSTRILFNDGTGNFTDATGAVWPGDGITYSFDFGDFDADGDLDILGVNSLSAREGIYVNNGAGTFTEMAATLLPGANNPNLDDNDSKWFDYDNDGDLDFVVARLIGTERIYRNDGASFTLTSGVIQNLNSSALDIEAGDIDGDGDYDLVIAVGESGTFTNRVYINSGPADTNPPTIAHVDSLASTNDVVGPYVVKAVIRDDMTSDRNFYPQELKLIVMLESAKEGAAPIEVPLLWMGYDQYRAELPGVPAGTTVTYSVFAKDAAGNETTGSPHSFIVGQPGDINGDGFVNGSDLAALLANWGMPGVSDINGDGTTNGVDLAALLAAWTG